MKKVKMMCLLATTMMLPAFAESYQAQWMTVTVNGELSKDYRNEIAVTMQREGSDLVFVVDGGLCAIGGKSGKELLKRELSATVKGETLVVKEALVSNEEGDKEKDFVLRGAKESFRIKDVPEGVEAVKFIYDDNTHFLGQTVMNPERYYAVGKIGEGEKKSLTRPYDSWESLHFIQHKEWVVYNPADAEGKSRIFRIRFSGMDEKAGVIPSYNLWLYESPEFDKRTASLVATMAGYNDAPYTLENVAVPSAFWGTGFKSATLNPAEMCKSDTFRPFVWDSDRGEQADVYDARYDQLYKGEATEKPFMSDGKMSVRYNVRESNLGNLEPEWEGEWVHGIGAVGDSYASNPFFPIYSLPENVTPAYLLYVRALDTNEILYGDPTLDPDFSTLVKEPEILGVESIPSAGTDVEWVIDSDRATVLCEGHGQMMIVGIDGVVHSQVDSEEVVSVNLQTLPKGVYILTFKNERGTESRKIAR